VNGRMLENMKSDTELTNDYNRVPSQMTSKHLSSQLIITSKSSFALVDHCSGASLILRFRSNISNNPF
ncbi:1249_t:CDS:1, partial [Acaulospora colombiana]